MTPTDPREQKGIVIAAMCRLERKNDEWLVPSQSVPERRYKVRLEGEGTCSCLDHTDGGYRCKHIRAVTITLKRELGTNGDVTETRTVTFTEKRTYPQVWSAYNHAQGVEKKRLQTLLFDLCRLVPEPERNCRGRKPHSRRDSIFTMAFKVYSTFSSRRFSCDLADAYEGGYLTCPVPGLKVPTFFENPVFTPILTQLISTSAAPLRLVESSFAVDSSGFSSSKFERWFDYKYNTVRRACVWVKAHIACGTKTNVITAVRILDKDAADSPQFAPLVKVTAGNFGVKEVSGDKAYLSNDNLQLVADLGGEAFIPFKENSTGGIGGIFEKTFRYFQFRREEYLGHYHKRSNVESTFSAVKRKFGDSVRSRTDVAMVNEVLCKFLCHNLCCLIQEEAELGIDPLLWGDGRNGGRPNALSMVRL